MAKACLDIFECQYCSSFTRETRSNYGHCKKLNKGVFEGTDFCEADGIINPNLWFMKEPHISNYLRMEIKYHENILPKHLDRKYYREKYGIV